MSRASRATWTMVYWLLSTTLCSLAHAAEEPPSSARTISLLDALRVGQEGPGVSVARAPRPALERAGSAARIPLTELPAVTIGSGHRSSTAGSGPEVTLQAMVDVPLRSVAGARTKAVRDELGAVELDVRRARMDAALRAAIAWSYLREASLVRELRLAAAEQSAGLAALATRRVVSGVSNPAEAALARGEAGIARAAAIDAEGKQTEAQVELRAAMRLPVDIAIAAIGDLCNPDAPLEDESISRQRAHAANPLIGLIEARARQARREVDVLRATLGPSVGVGGYAAREGTGDLIFMGMVALPLPIFERGGFDAARAGSQADVAAARVDLVKMEVDRDVHLSVHERHHTRELHAALMHDAAVPLREALRTARALFEAGTHDATTVLLARRRVSEIEEQVVRACGEIRRADLRWMRIVGAPELNP